MGERAITSVRCDGLKIEVLTFKDDQLFIHPVTPEQALRLAHTLMTHALQMIERRDTGS